MIQTEIVKGDQISISQEVQPGKSSEDSQNEYSKPKGALKTTGQKTSCWQNIAFDCNYVSKL